MTHINVVFYNVLTILTSKNFFEKCNYVFTYNSVEIHDVLVNCIDQIIQFTIKKF